MIQVNLYKNIIPGKWLRIHIFRYWFCMTPEFDFINRQRILQQPCRVLYLRLPFGAASLVNTNSHISPATGIVSNYLSAKMITIMNAIKQLFSLLLLLTV